MEKGIPVITYFGATGHGKCLVDAIIAFGVKSPQRKEVVTRSTV